VGRGVFYGAGPTGASSSYKGTGYHAGEVGGDENVGGPTVFLRPLVLPTTEIRQRVAPVFEAGAEAKGPDGAAAMARGKRLQSDIAALAEHGPLATKRKGPIPDYAYGPDGKPLKPQYANDPDFVDRSNPITNARRMNDYIHLFQQVGIRTDEARDVAERIGCLPPTPFEEKAPAGGQ